MIKSPEQWAKTFNRISKSKSEVVNLDLTISSILELEKMMMVLSTKFTVDEIKSLIEEV